MSPPKSTARAKAAPAPAKPPSRALIVLTGAVLGAVWGTIMWAIFALAGDGNGVAGWAYVTISVAMIGCGVAAVFGASSARKRGERIGPRLFGRRGRGG
jgi:hypothetical protein